MTFDGPEWRRIASFALAAFLGGVAAGGAQFTSFNDRKTSILEGNWQSCREGDGQYSERVYDGKWPGLPPFELHLGPNHEFALFQGVDPSHRDHRSADNLLQPYVVELKGNSARQSWDVAGLKLDVALVGGSREQCESWFIALKRSTTSSH